MTFDDIWMVALEVQCHERSFNFTWWHFMTCGDIWLHYLTWWLFSWSGPTRDRPRDSIPETKRSLKSNIFVLIYFRSELTNMAMKASIQVFASNLKRLLLTPPVRGKVVLGIDPGFRNGCKWAMVSKSGKMKSIQRGLNMRGITNFFPVWSAHTNHLYKCCIGQLVDPESYTKNLI